MAPVFQWIFAAIMIILLWKMVTICSDPDLIQAVQDWWADDTESWWDRPSPAGQTVTLCSLCHREAMQPCERCQSATYCSTACQKEHWKRGHKSECLELPQSTAGSRRAARARHPAPATLHFPVRGLLGAPG
eukprot:jgi/Botrbrau1/16260/Bobra.0066s0044.1